MPEYENEKKNKYIHKQATNIYIIVSRTNKS